MIDDIRKELEKHTEIVPSGSNYICNPPVNDTDIDYFVLNTVDVKDILKDAGFTTSADINEYPEDDFTSYRKGNVNIILLSTRQLLKDTKLATELCKYLNLLKKVERVVVFNTIQYGRVTEINSRDWDTSLDLEVPF